MQMFVDKRKKNILELEPPSRDQPKKKIKVI